MDCVEERVDMRIPASEEDREKNKELMLNVYKFNNLPPFSAEQGELLKKIFKKIGGGSRVGAPINGVCFNNVAIGKKVVVGANCLMMARGSITIEDDVMIAQNCQLISNNHDVYDRQILTCKPVLIKKGAWLGAGSTILPGVSIGKYAVVGAASVVTKDVPDYGVVVGSPAKLIKTLDPSKFND